MPLHLHNRFHNSSNITMNSEKELAMLRCDIGDVTRLRSDVQNRSTNRENVVDLARVHDANELFTHHNDVQVSRRQRA